MKSSLMFLLCLLLISGCEQLAPSGQSEQQRLAAQMKVDTARTFSGDIVQPEKKSPYIDYDWPVMIEEFVVAEPKKKDPNKKYGLLVYITPHAAVAPPADWLAALAERDMMYIAPKKVGNTEDNERRTGMAVIAAELMKRDENIDPDRVYLSGLSGGARTANAVAYMHPEIFSGAVLICGACFARDVPQKKETPNPGRQGGFEYTVIFDKAFVDEAAVKERVGFALITGPKDFRYGNMLDIYEGGYRPSGYRARLFDIPNMGHQNCTGEVLGQAIDFLDEGR